VGGDRGKARDEVTTHVVVKGCRPENTRQVKKAHLYRGEKSLESLRNKFTASPRRRQGACTEGTSRIKKMGNFLEKSPEEGKKKGKKT